MLDSPSAEIDLTNDVQPADDAGLTPVGIGESSRLLRKSHLHNAQAKAIAQFAPYLCMTGIATAALVAWALFGNMPAPLLGGWLCSVVAAFLWAAKRASALGALQSRSLRLSPQTTILSGAILLAALWSSLPIYAFPAQSQAVQFVIVGAIGALIMAAIGLIAVPVAAFTWIGVFTAALCTAYWFAAGTVVPQVAMTLIAVAVLAILGVGRLTRWGYGQLEDSASVRAEAEAAKLMLREYENRGVGWLWHVDNENRLIYISSRMTALVDRTPAQALGHSLAALLGGHSGLGRALLARQPFGHLEMELATRRGKRWVSLSGDPIIDIAGNFQGFRGVGSDITEMKKQQERLTNLANLDLLSGLPNRGRVRQLLGEALAIAQQGNRQCAIMFLDLDGFKPVNDTYGHPRGDAVLKGVATRLVKEVGNAGHVGRMGGDEFAIVIHDGQSRQAVEALCDRLIDAIARPFYFDKAEIRIGVSIGCAFGPIDGRSVDDLIQKADLALYQAKNEGRARACYYQDGMQSVAEHRMRLEKDLEIAIDKGQLRLFYQPLVRASDQSLMGFEALVRWFHPERGMISPAEFIPLAEETGLIRSLGEWVIDEACRAASQWPSQISVALNLSARQLSMASLPAKVSGALGRYKVQPSRIELEVTESVFLEDSQGSLDVLKRLRTLGVGIALDDFGTGYSSLGYLNKAVFHKLKIDGSFVRESARNKETVAIIQSIVHLANSFRMAITAEGIETADDFQRMRDLGCYQMQGYLFGKPMAFEAATELVRSTQQRKSA